jgi:tetratricopeptide (TPR) repeat protein
MELGSYFVATRTNKRHHHHPRWRQPPRCGGVTLASLNNMANIYMRQGKYEEALEVHRKSLEIRTRIYGGDSHPLVADSWNNIGEVLRNTGRYEETIEMHAKSLCTATSNQWRARTIILLYCTRVKETKHRQTRWLVRHTTYS